MNFFYNIRRFCIDTANYDRFSDPDSLSFNSLSRSSSLIQFESLERQIQTGETQLFGGSSPSINNLNTNQESNNKIDLNASKSNENQNNDVNATRNYYDIEKIDFNSALYLNCQEPTSSSESSCSTDNSIYYSDNHNEIETGAKEKTQRTIENAKMAFRNKNSVENLSEDSGYGEISSIKCRSKSIPNLNKDQLLDIDEELDQNYRSLNDINKCKSNKMSEMSDIQSKCQSRFGDGSNKRTNNSSKIKTIHSEHMRSVEHAISSFGASKNSTLENGWSNDDNEHVFSTQTNKNGIRCKNSSTSVTSMQNKNSTSLPDILVYFTSDCGNNYSSINSIFFSIHIPIEQNK